MGVSRQYLSLESRSGKNRRSEFAEELPVKSCMCLFILGVADSVNAKPQPIVMWCKNEITAGPVGSQPC